nr:hypothetical protein GCM10020092_044470 [Actinoplanes digitatis]
MLVGQPNRGVHRLDPLGDLAHLGEDVVQPPSTAELLADVPVAALRADARRHQVAHSGQPGERVRLAAHRDRQRGQLGESAGDHPGPGVVADAETLRDARGDGHDVLQRTADLAADHVVVGVHPQQAAPEHLLDRGGDGEVLRGDHGGRRHARHDLLGQVGAGERGGRMPRKHLLDHLGHPQQRVAFETLAEAHHGDPRVQVRPDLLQGGAERPGRHADDEQLGVRRRLGEVRGGAKPAR